VSWYSELFPSSPFLQVPDRPQESRHVCTKRGMPSSCDLLNSAFPYSPLFSALDTMVFFFYNDCLWDQPVSFKRLPFDRGSPTGVARRGLKIPPLAFRRKGTFSVLYALSLSVQISGLKSRDLFFFLRYREDPRRFPLLLLPGPFPTHSSLRYTPSQTCAALEFGHRPYPS